MDICHGRLNKGSNQLLVELEEGILLPIWEVHHRDHLWKASQLVDVATLQLELVDLLGQHGDLLKLHLIGDCDRLNCGDMSGKGLPGGLPFSHKRSNGILVVRLLLCPLKSISVRDIICLVLLEGFLRS